MIERFSTVHPMNSNTTHMHPFFVSNDAIMTITLCDGSRISEKVFPENLRMHIAELTRCSIATAVQEQSW